MSQLYILLLFTTIFRLEGPMHTFKKLMDMLVGGDVVPHAVLYMQQTLNYSLYNVLPLYVSITQPQRLFASSLLYEVFTLRPFLSSYFCLSKTNSLAIPLGNYFSCQIISF